MKKLMLICAMCLVFISCSKDNPREYRFADNGLIYNYNDDELYTGRIIDTADVVVQYDVVKGIKNGRFVTYYNNGNVEKSGWIEANSNIGEWKYFYPDGSLETSGHFKKDLPDGLWQFFYKDGSLKQSGTYKDGVEHGEWLFYDEEGNLKKYFYYHQGQILNSIINSI